MNNDEVTLGIRNIWGQDTPVLLSCKDRRQHLYVVGKSGTGKTTLLCNIILQDIEAGRGVGVIDPHGDLAIDILDHIPSHRVDDIVFFDPSDEEHAVAFNLLARVPPSRRHLIASGIVGAFKAIYPDFFGPRMEYVFFAAVSALLECEHVSLLGLPRMLTDERYRAWVVKQVKDPVVRKYWEQEFESHDKRTKTEIISPILNKIGPMFMSPHIRNILGQVKGRIDARYMMDNKKIFIANLSKGKLGEEKANLLGSFLVSQFQIAAMSRADIPEAQRKDFYLYVDEFHSFVSTSFTSILSEARKYRLCLTISHQYLGQLKPGIAEAVVGNVGSIVGFRIGHQDAKSLELTFGTPGSAGVLTTLSNGEVYAKLLSNGSDTDAFILRTHPPTGQRYARTATILQRSREKYSAPKQIVEERIRRWLTPKQLR